MTKTAFIVGCGRSGTTILGTILSQHPDVSYLNDRFDLWVRPFGFADIWGIREDAAVFKPRITLSAVDVTAEGRSVFGELLEQERRGKQVVIEKLAINNFRIGFLMGLAPQAAIISIVRHGVEVAHSIEAKAEQGHWYGKDGVKWTYLVEYARSAGYGHLLPLCQTHFDRALLEWRMSVDAADAHLKANPQSKVLSLRYEDLIADADAVCRRLESFLGIAASLSMHQYTAAQVKRRSLPAGERPVPASTEAIAGPALRRLGYWR